MAHQQKWKKFFYWTLDNGVIKESVDESDGIRIQMEEHVSAAYATTSVFYAVLKV